MAGGSPVKRQETRDADELGAFLSAFASTRLEVAWHLLVDAGMRIGEVPALRWADVDAESGRIDVRNAVVGVPYTALAVPPAWLGARVISASPGVQDALRRHRRRQDAERSEWGEHYRDADLVVCREDGGPLHPRALNRVLRHEGLGLADLRRQRTRFGLSREALR